MVRQIAVFGLAVTLLALAALAQAPVGPPGRGGMTGGAQQPGGGVPPGPPPTHADLDYAPADPPSSNGHKLDLYVPSREEPRTATMFAGVA